MKTKGLKQVTLCLSYDQSSNILGTDPGSEYHASSMTNAGLTIK